MQRFAKSAVSGEIVSDTRREQRGTTRLEIFVSSERRGIVLPSTIPLLCVDECDRTTRQNSGTRAQNQKYDGTKDGGSSDQRIQRDRRLDKGAVRQGERSMRDDGRGHETTDHEPRDRRRRKRRLSGSTYRVEKEGRTRTGVSGRSTHIVTIIGLGWAHCLSFNFPAGFPPRTMAGTLYKSRELHGRTKLVNISVES